MHPTGSLMCLLAVKRAGSTKIVAVQEFQTAFEPCARALVCVIRSRKAGLDR